MSNNTGCEQTIRTGSSLAPPSAIIIKRKIRDTDTITEIPPSPLLDNNDKLASTTFKGGNGSYGMFFKITALRHIRITGLDFHTDRVNQTLRVELYTKLDDYIGYENVTSSWTQIVNTTVNDGIIPWGPTPIPSNEFESVAMSKDEERSFYITLTTEDLRYSDSEYDTNSVYVRTNDMLIHVGKGVDYYPAFDTSSQDGSFFDRRVFNGVIHYQVIGDNGSSELERSYPFDEMLSSSNDVIEDFAAGSGVMFTIESKKPMLISNIDCLIRNNETVKAEVWTKDGEFDGYENDRFNNWTRIVETYVPKAKMQREPTPIGNRFDPPILMNAGGMRSFYVTMPQTDIIYSTQSSGGRNNETSNDIAVGTVYVENDDIKLFVGIGVSHLFGDVHIPRIFHGNIRYKLSSTTTSTPEPQEDSTEEQISQSLITLTGDSSRRMQRLLMKSRNLPSKSIEAFQSVAARHVEKFGKKYSLKIKGAYVSFPSEDEVETVDGRRMWFRHLRSSSSIVIPRNLELKNPSGTKAADDNDDGFDKLDMYTTFVGEYTPPPILDLSEITNDSFQDDGEAFVSNLRESNPVFEEVQSVTSKPVKFPLPPALTGKLPEQPSTVEEADHYNYRHHLIIGSTFAVALLCAFLLVMGLFAWNIHKEKLNAQNARKKEIELQDDQQEEEHKQPQPQPQQAEHQLQQQPEQQRKESCFWRWSWHQQHESKKMRWSHRLLLDSESLEEEEEENTTSPAARAHPSRKSETGQEGEQYFTFK